MSSDAPTNVPVPRTAVPLGIGDPVEKARAELKAALAAIETKANVPRRVGNAVDRGIVKARAFSQRNPAAAAVAVVVGAAAVGAAVWGLVRLYSR
ncbi:hypothetical protein [Microbacterium hominis]|uniref:DUF3618 domain-containing protein n=1 Tax=Microbacterium hominis TaxID=162426 RepID=A0A7D4PP30_9MICO|nr:hypothetical protein [Microbacterium hominis]QKJ20755.1 hypothetical protein HQM25_16255 [Microbacterium hominis]